MLSPRLQLKVAQKQILTPGLVQMVTVLQLNRMELKEMINQEIVENPVLEESLEEGEEITPEELQPLLEAERSAEPADQSLLDAADIKLDGDAPEVARNHGRICRIRNSGGRSWSGMHRTRPRPLRRTRSTKSTSVRFSTTIWTRAIRVPASESVEKPSFETFLSQPQTLPDYLRSQLSVSRAGRRNARRGGIDHRQSGRRRLSDRHAGRDGAAGRRTRRRSWRRR